MHPRLRPPCFVATRKSSPNIEYLLALWNSSSINPRGFRDMELENGVFGKMACITVSMLTLSSYNIAPSNLFMKLWINSPHSIFTWNKRATACFRLMKHKYWLAKISDNPRNDLIQLSDSRGTKRKGPYKLDRNTLHNKGSFLLLRVITWRKSIKWLKGSPNIPLYMFEFEH